MHESQVYENSSGENGGGVYLDTEKSGSAQIYSTLFHHNTASQSGGAIATSNSNRYTYTLSVVNDTIVSNDASNKGGGIYIADPIVFNMTNAIIANNISGVSHSGIYAEGTFTEETADNNAIYENGISNYITPTIPSPNHEVLKLG